MAFKNFEATPEDNDDFNGVDMQGSALPSKMSDALEQVGSEFKKLNDGTDPIQDTMTFEDPDDATKQFRFDGGSITGGNKRIVSIPDKDVELVDTTNFSVSEAGDITATAFSGGGFGFRNKFINPSFQVDIEGNAAGTTVSGDHVVEGWIGSFSNGVTTQTISRVSGDQEKYALQYQVTTGSDASIAAGDFAVIQTAIEGYDVADFGFGAAGGETVYLNFRVKSSVSGIHCLALRNADSNRSYVAEYTISSANTWQDVAIEIPADTTGTWDATNGRGLNVLWCLAAGSTFHTSNETWSSSNSFATSNQVNVLATPGNTFSVEAEPRLSRGGPIPVEHVPYSWEFDRCNRYYEVVGVLLLTTVWSTTATQLKLSPKRTVPTLTTTPQTGSGGTYALYSDTLNADNLIYQNGGNNVASGGVVTADARLI